MKQDILISIILPTYNRSSTIERSVHSILNQSYHKFELIIVDDGSEDNTNEIIKILMRNDSRIKYIRNNIRKGANAARNIGIKNSNGEYIAFQDSDDEWLPDKLKIQINSIIGTDISVSFSSFWRFINNKKEYIPKKRLEFKEGVRQWTNELIKGNFISTQTLLVKKDALLKVGLFDESLPRFQDWDISIRLSKYYQFIFIDKPLVNIFISNDSISRNKFLFRPALNIILRKHRIIYESHPDAMIILYLNLLYDSITRKEVKFSFFYFKKVCSIFRSESNSFKSIFYSVVKRMI